MREKLDDDDDDVYKELVYISKRCFCVALFCVFVSSTQLFFSQLFRDESNFVAFKFRVLGFRVLFETLNFLYFCLSLQNSKARDSFDAKRARFSSRLFRGVRVVV